MFKTVWYLIRGIHRVIYVYFCIIITVLCVIGEDIALPDKKLPYKKRLY